MEFRVFWLYVGCIFFFLTKDFVIALPNLYCGTCEALVDEVEYAISSADQKRMLEVGSFRIDPEGKQKKEKIKYAGSESNLHDIFEEDICKTMTDYAISTSELKSDEQKYVRYNSRGPEKKRVVDNVAISAHISKAMEVACGNILDEYEDEITAAFVNETPNTKEAVCKEITGYCTNETLPKDEL